MRYERKREREREELSEANFPQMKTKTATTLKEDDDEQIRRLLKFSAFSRESTGQTGSNLHN